MIIALKEKQRLQEQPPVQKELKIEKLKRGAPYAMESHYEITPAANMQRSVHTRSEAWQ